MARRFALEGARVAVNDLDGAAAEEVAAEIGGHVVPGDAAGAERAARLVAEARDRLGPIDLFCANAGVAEVGGAEAPDEAWTRSWEINVLSHVHAARALLPAWLDRGAGHFVATVSAAGLLTQIGSAPYAVTKHAALAFAEWLSVTYGDRGITVQALCPQGVRTDLLARADDRIRALLEPDALTPEDVARSVVSGLADGRFLILPHPEVARYMVHRATDPDRWLAGMRRLQDRLG
jgi:NAD(P)-dependent dehydrogenase (short-subunit alcohol dehydrogenase family)